MILPYELGQNKSKYTRNVCSSHIRKPSSRKYVLNFLSTSWNTNNTFVAFISNTRINLGNKFHFLVQPKHPREFPTKAFQVAYQIQRSNSILRNSKDEARCCNLYFHCAAQFLCNRSWREFQVDQVLCKTIHPFSIRTHTKPPKFCLDFSLYL